ncbi:MAG: hypothetical protein Q9187_004182 [Circinaria calcarea]
MATDHTSAFLRLPAEIRDQIIGEVPFPDEKHPEEYDQNNLGLAPTAVRQIFPYHWDAAFKPKFEVAIIRTCRQLQIESEAILYGTSSWNLMYQDWSDSVKLSYEFFETFPRRLRRLIRRVERKCYSESYHATISLLDWKYFMAFLANECPNLHSLILWGPGDEREGPWWVETCRKDKEWVEAILQIKSLTYFDIPVIKGGVIYDFPEFKDEFLPWLKSSLLQQPKRPSNNVVASGPQDYNNCRQNLPFRFLDLDRSVRDRVYRFALLPANRRIHPYIKPWLDTTTKNVIPLLSTCQQIRDEAEIVLYSFGIFTSPIRKYDAQLLRFFKGCKRRYVKKLAPRLLELVRTVRVGSGARIKPTLLLFLARRMQLQTLELSFTSEMEIRIMNRDWIRKAPDNIPAWKGCLQQYHLRDLARIPRVLIETPAGSALNLDCLNWLTVGLRRKLLLEVDDRDTMKWLYDGEENLWRYESEADLISDPEEEVNHEVDEQEAPLERRTLTV